MEKVPASENSEEKFRDQIERVQSLRLRAHDLCKQAHRSSARLKQKEDAHSRYLEDEHPGETNYYQAYHILLGSSGATDCKYFDFSDPDESIERFYQARIEELKNDLNQ